MTFPLLYFTEGCCGTIPEATSTRNIVQCTLRNAWIFDALSVVTSLVVAILGIYGIIGMPPTAAYALIGVGVIFASAWLAMIIHNACTEPETP